MIKRAMLLVSMLAIGCGSSPLVPRNMTQPKLFVYNLTVPERNPEFRIGDSIRIAASEVRQEDDLKLCYEFTRTRPPFGSERSCNQSLQDGSFVPSGTWHIEYQLLPSYAGTWKSWIVVNGVESNHVTYMVGGLG